MTDKGCAVPGAGTAGTILSVNISAEKGTIKTPVDHALITRDGVENDAHSGQWHRQVSLLSADVIRDFEKKVGRTVAPGEFAENLTVEGMDLQQAAPLDTITVAGAQLEVTQIGKECHGTSCAIFKELGDCAMPREGIFCRVLEPGTVTTGDKVTLHERLLRIVVITVSDRASRGDYEDRSGPAIIDQLNEHFAPSRWHEHISSACVPDDEEKIRAAIRHADGADVILTTGGTGVGPRDITPDVVSALLDKELPGIMEHIRTTYGKDKPNALLSRSVAGLMGDALVYTLPGSVKAVNEYMCEILKTMEHLILMRHGLGHG